VIVAGNSPTSLTVQPGANGKLLKSVVCRLFQKSEPTFQNKH